MPRSMWKGVVSFGMVSIPIRLYNRNGIHLEGVISPAVS